MSAVDLRALSSWLRKLASGLPSATMENSGMLSPDVQTVLVDEAMKHAVGKPLTRLSGRVEIKALSSLWAKGFAFRTIASIASS